MSYSYPFLWDEKNTVKISLVYTEVNSYHSEYEITWTENINPLMFIGNSFRLYYSLTKLLIYITA